MTPALQRELDHAAATGEPVSADAALAVLRAPPEDLPAIFAAAHAVKQREFGNRVFLCAIMNARSGACSEDCAFCAQSAHHRTHVDVYGLREADVLCGAYDEAAGLPVDHFGVVTSGEGMKPADVEKVAAVMETHRKPGLAWCVSLGTLEPDQLARLKGAGVHRFHHNLETAPSFFPAICSTHTFEQRLAMLRKIKAAGLEVCSGGILGLGESLEQRVEFAGVLAREGVTSIPLNFLVAVPGTRLAGTPPLSPLDILRSIAMFRLMNPKAEVKVCAGRIHLRDLQSQVFLAGATGLMIGPFLTTAGRDVAADLQMLRDLEVEVLHAR